MNGMKKKYVIMGVVIFIALYLFRVINIDQDLPAWGIANYQPMDEGQYATMAINKYKYGTMRPDLKVDDIQFNTNAHFRNDLIGNIVCYIGLRLFGNNYIGLRMGSVVVGFLNFAILCLCMVYFYKNSAYTKNKAKITILLTTYFLLDFTFLLSSRIMETTIYRQLFLLLILLIYIYINKYNKLRFFLIGQLVVISVFLVYITNIFLFFSCLGIIIVLGIMRGIKYFYDSIINFIAGCGIGYIICDLYYSSVWGTSCIQNTLQIVSDFSNNADYANASGLSEVVEHIISFFSANCNIYNIGFSTIALIALPFLICYCKKRKDENVCFVLIILFTFFIQTLVSEDYIIRKYILVYPLIILLVYIIGIYSGEESEEIGKTRILGKLCYYLYVIGVSCLNLSMIVRRFFFNDDGIIRDYSKIDIVIIVSVSLIEIVIILVQQFKEYKLSILEKNVTFSIIACVILSGCVNQYMAIKYVWTNPTFTEKQIMTELQEDVGDNYAFGIYAIGFSLYNNIKPVTNSYDKLNTMIGEHVGSYYLDYSLMEGEPLDEIMNTDGTTWESYKEYNRNFAIYGEKKKISVWKIVEKSEWVE